ncbi:MAG: acyl-CoA dehydrogenase [Gemmatimonadetes bacterium]|nr:acyl-CoA dehydrogenase [Gemmatimonadota bacterium]NNK61580.1 acyl-CoA dehydrogenase [Gemmatimonadota bacterium]
MKRTIFTPEHDHFRESVRGFIEREIRPHHDQWIADGIVPRDAWLKAGVQGLLCMAAPEEFGGAGVEDFRYPMILAEELHRANCTGPGFGIHSTIVAPYILKYGTDEQRGRWVPGMVSGETILAVGMTEPGAGSDLSSVQTTAVDAGDHYVVTGSKSFVSNAVSADLILISCATDPEKKAFGVSVLAVDPRTPGVTVGTPLAKVGWHAQDTAEVFLDEVSVPKENMIGKPGQGAFLMARELDQERLLISVGAVASARAALDWTIDYCKERHAFGQPIGKFQNSRFALAEMETELTIAQTFVDRCVTEWNEGGLKAPEVAMAKWWTTALQQRVIDRCVQLHGGYGYMTEYPIAQAWLDMRWTPIGGGTNEIMKELIGRSMGF